MIYNRAKLSECIHFSLSDTGPEYQVSSNFKLKEFACHDGNDTVIVHPMLVELLQHFREYFHSAVSVNSAYRTPKHNKLVGGRPKSRHLFGVAADIVIANHVPNEVATYAENIDVAGVGRYDTFTHVDVWHYNRRWDNTSPATTTP